MSRPPGMSGWGLAAEALLCLAVARAATRWLPFRMAMCLAAPRLRRRAPGDVAAQVRWAISMAGRRAPWRAACLQQGLAAQLMLRRRGLDSRLYFGARSDGARGPSAHVWVRADGRDVVGGAGALGFAVLATYPPGGDCGTEEKGLRWWDEMAAKSR